MDALAFTDRAIAGYWVAEVNTGQLFLAIVSSTCFVSKSRETSAHLLLCGAHTHNVIYLSVDYGCTCTYIQPMNVCVCVYVCVHAILSVCCVALYPICTYCTLYMYVHAHQSCLFVCDIIVVPYMYVHCISIYHLSGLSYMSYIVCVYIYMYIHVHVYT